MFDWGRLQGNLGRNVRTDKGARWPLGWQPKWQKGLRVDGGEAPAFWEVRFGLGGRRSDVRHPQPSHRGQRRRTADCGQRSTGHLASRAPAAILKWCCSTPDLRAGHWSTQQAAWTSALAHVSVSRIRRGSTLAGCSLATSLHPPSSAQLLKQTPDCQKQPVIASDPQRFPQSSASRSRPFTAQRASPSAAQDRRRTAQFSQGHGPSTRQHPPPIANHSPLECIPTPTTPATQMAPSTFASAAAGSNSTANSTRPDSGGEWSVQPPLCPPRDKIPTSAPPTCPNAAAHSIRPNVASVDASRDADVPRSRRANGATQTFRRPSHATTLSNAASTNASSPGVYVPPHRNGTATAENRYPKDSILSLFRQIPLDSDEGLSELYAGGWEPQATNGASGGAWGRSIEHGKENPPGPDVCWDREGNMQPMGLNEMTEEEKEVSLCYSVHASFILFVFCSFFCTLAMVSQYQRWLTRL